MKLEDLKNFIISYDETWFVECHSKEIMELVLKELKLSKYKWQWDPTYFKETQYNPYGAQGMSNNATIYLTLYQSKIRNSYYISYSFYKTEKIKSFNEIQIDYKETEEKAKGEGNEVISKNKKSKFKVGDNVFISAACREFVSSVSNLSSLSSNSIYILFDMGDDYVELRPNSTGITDLFGKQYDKNGRYIKKSFWPDGKLEKTLELVGENKIIKEDSKTIKVGNITLNKQVKTKVKEDSNTIRVGGITLNKKKKPVVKEDSKTIKVGDVVLKKQDTKTTVCRKEVQPDGQIWFHNDLDENGEQAQEEKVAKTYLGSKQKTKKFNINNRKERNKTMSEEIKNSLVKGAKIGASKKAAKVLTTTVKKMLGDNYPEFLKTPLGQMLEPFIVPAAVVFLLDRFAAGDGGEGCFDDERLAKIYEVANLALEGEAAERVEELLGMLNPQIDALVAKL